MKLLSASVFALSLSAGYTTNANAAMYPLNTSNVLVLENSVVDLQHNIEILRLDLTKGIHYCDLYSSLHGQKSTLSACLSYKDYHYIPLSISDGWRIGDGSELVNLLKLVAYHSVVQSPTSVSLTGDYLAQWVDDSLGNTRLFNGFPSFLLNTSVFSGSYSRRLDLINHSVSTTSTRMSYSTLYSALNQSGTLLVRDWSGERDVFAGSRASFNVPVSGVWAFSLMAALMCFTRSGRKT